MTDTYQAPEHGWTCFHCGETFKKPGSARDHFGADQTATPGCLIKVSPGGELSLLMSLRKSEAMLSEYMNDSSAHFAHACEIQSRHSEHLRRAEEAGYERGLRDADLSRLIGELTSSEGSTITIYNQNPDFTGPNNRVDITRDFEGIEKRYFGETLIETLEKAVADMVNDEPLDEVGTDSMADQAV